MENISIESLKVQAFLALIQTELLYKSLKDLEKTVDVKVQLLENKDIYNGLRKIMSKFLNHINGNEALELIKSDMLISGFIDSELKIISLVALESKNYSEIVKHINKLHIDIIKEKDFKPVIEYIILNDIEDKVATINFIRAIVPNVVDVIKEKNKKIMFDNIKLDVNYKPNEYLFEEYVKSKLNRMGLLVDLSKNLYVKNRLLSGDFNNSFIYEAVFENFQVSDFNKMDKEVKSMMFKNIVDFKKIKFGKTGFAEGCYWDWILKKSPNDVIDYFKEISEDKPFKITNGHGIEMGGNDIFLNRLLKRLIDLSSIDFYGFQKKIPLSFIKDNQELFFSNIRKENIFGNKDISLFDLFEIGDVRTSMLLTYVGLIIKEDKDLNKYLSEKIKSAIFANLIISSTEKNVNFKLVQDKFTTEEIGKYLAENKRLNKWLTTLVENKKDSAMVMWYENLILTMKMENEIKTIPLNQSKSIIKKI